MIKAASVILSGPNCSTVFFPAEWRRRRRRRPVTDAGWSIASGLQPALFQPRSLFVLVSVLVDKSLWQRSFRGALMSVAVVVLYIYRRITAGTSSSRAEQFSSLRGLFCFSWAVRKFTKWEMEDPSAESLSRMKTAVYRSVRWLTQTFKYIYKLKYITVMLLLRIFTYFIRCIHAYCYNIHYNQFYNEKIL